MRGIYINTKRDGRREWKWKRDGRMVIMQEHVLVWEQHFGPVPDGYHVHHIDCDPSNNDIGNLRCMPAEDHMRLHHPRIPLRVCDVCGRRAKTFVQGVCNSCYDHWRLYGVMEPPKRRRGKYVNTLCACGQPVRAKGKCNSCYHREYKRHQRGSFGYEQRRAA